MKNGQLGITLTSFPVIIAVVVIMAGFLVLSGFGKLLTGAPSSANPHVPGYVYSKPFLSQFITVSVDNTSLTMSVQDALIQSEITKSFWNDLVLGLQTLPVKEGECIILHGGTDEHGESRDLFLIHSNGRAVIADARDYDVVQDRFLRTDQRKSIYRFTHRDSSNNLQTSIFYYYYGRCSE